MKCNAQLIYYKKLTKTGRRKLYTSLPYNWTVETLFGSVSEKALIKLDLENVQVCGGKIIAQIGCHEEPTYNEDGGTYPEMDVNFICENCKQYYHPNLPRGVEELNEWLTEIIEKFP